MTPRIFQNYRRPERRGPITTRRRDSQSPNAWGPTPARLPLSLHLPATCKMAFSIARSVLTRRKSVLLAASAVYSTHDSTGMHVSATRHALTRFNMPAMSPTMTEGGIASWKLKEGEAFSTGDVLLEIVRPPPQPPSSHLFMTDGCVTRKRTRPPSTSRPRKMVCWPKSSCVVRYPLHSEIY